MQVWVELLPESRDEHQRTRVVLELIFVAWVACSLPVAILLGYCVLSEA